MSNRANEIVKNHLIETPQAGDKGDAAALRALSSSPVAGVNSLRIVLSVTKKYERENELNPISREDRELYLLISLRNGVAMRPYRAPNVSTADLLQPRVFPKKM